MMTETKGRLIEAIIPSGVLTLEMEREDIPLEQALAFAARHNQQRGFLFVSKLLGRHIPTPPKALREAASALARKIAAAQPMEPCLFIGMAETATALGQTVFREWSHLGGEGFYLDTTRRRTGGKIAFDFNESHSHAPRHLVHQPESTNDLHGVFDRAASLIIVDDELTTGRTASELARAYAKYRGAPMAAHLAVLVRWLGDKSVPLCCHSLLDGRFTFAPSPDFLPESFAPCDAGGPSVAHRGARHGVSISPPMPWRPEPPGHILVIGVGEFGFAPFLLAEQIETTGGNSYLQATTRSPVALGGAIGHVRRFPAISGEGYEEFLYNVPDDHPYERVILCCEDRLPPPGHPILRVPKIECRLAP